MIKLENVSKKFKKRSLFQPFDMTIEDNERVLLRGINGSGKSVILKMILGYSIPDTGTISFDGNILHEKYDFLQNVGAFINAPEFIGSWSGRQNLKYLAGIRKIATDEDISILAKRFELESDLDDKYRHYSLGMKQKLRIIQALMDRPKYLIMDEPFDALDKSARKILKDVLDEFMEDGEHTLIFTTHEEESKMLADKIYEIDGQKVTLV